MMEDTFRHKGLRRQLVETLKAKGITDKRVLAAIGKIPRHFFVESYLDVAAYDDRALPIASGQTISQPFTVAWQTQLLKVQKGDRVLEIGTGSGYQTAVLLEMDAKVFSVERHHSLYLKASSLLSLLKYNPYLFFGDGYEGKPTYGPFDKILVTAAAEEIPSDLLRQLSVGGLMVVPLGGRHGQKMTRIVRQSTSEFEREEFGDFQFVPMLKGIVK